MRHPSFIRRKPGTTLVELLLFLAFFGLSSGVLLAFFFMTSEQRVRQQTIASVERSGVQLLQTLGNRIRNAERILDPQVGASGSVLALQYSDDSMHPTVIGRSGATLFLGQADTFTQLSPDDVAITNLRLRNTSPASDRAAVLVSFTVSRTVALSVPLSYERTFEALFELFPDDHADPVCGCSTPSCSAGIYTWQYCAEDVCTDANAYLLCE